MCQDNQRDDGGEVRGHGQVAGCDRGEFRRGHHLRHRVPLLHVLRGHRRLLRLEVFTVMRNNYNL